MARPYRNRTLRNIQERNHRLERNPILKLSDGPLEVFVACLTRHVLGFDSPPTNGSLALFLRIRPGMVTTYAKQLRAMGLLSGLIPTAKSRRWFSGLGIKVIEL